MPTERYEAGRLRERWDDLARVYTAWDAAGVETQQRAFTAEENAEADAAATVGNRDKNRATLLDRIAGNQANLRAIATAASFNNTQRDDALRLLARNAAAQNKILEGIAGRLAALDTTD